MNEAVIIVSTLSILFSLIALITGCIAISICVGLKNSTHSIVWKPLDSAEGLGEPRNPADEFLAPDEIPEDNPLRAKRPKKEKVPDPLDFMEDVTDQNGF